MMGFRDFCNTTQIGDGARPERKPDNERPLNGGIQLRYKFANGRGASVIRHSFSYGAERGNWELAVTDGEWRIDYTTPLTDDVIGDLTAAQVDDLLNQIEALPAFGGGK